MKFRNVLPVALTVVGIGAGTFGSVPGIPHGAAQVAGCWGAIAAESKPQYSVIKKLPLGGDGGWDFLCIDGPSRRLYIARSNRVMVVDIDSDRLVGEVGGTTDAAGGASTAGVKAVSGGTVMAGVHGVCVLPDLNKGFVSSGKDDTVRVFDLKSLKQIGQVKTGSKPDAVIYDPASKTIFAFNNGGTTVTVIDPSSDKTNSIELGGAPESAVADGKGKMYVNLEDKSEVAVIDIKEMTVTNHWPLAPGTEPTGLAIDVKHHRLFSACKNKTMCVLDADTGKLITSLPIGDSVDFAIFDPHTEDVFSSNGDGTLTVIHESTPDSFAVVQNVETQKGARTMAIDPEKHHIWLATATMSMPSTDAATTDSTSTSADRPKRRVMVPGSFVLLVVGKK